MYFQQIFWCVYDKGSDLAGDRPFLKRQIICRPEHWPKHLFPHKWRQEGGKRETKKGGHSRWKKSRWQWHCLSPNLKSRKFASCLCLSFEVNLWIGIRKKTQHSAWLSCKQCFREQTIHTLTLFLFLFLFVSRRCHMSSHTEHSDQHEQTPKKGTSAKSTKPRIRPATVRL